MRIPSRLAGRNAGPTARRLPAGVADAAFSSIATLVCGIVAVRRLEPNPLGVYALFNGAFLVAAVVPAALVFTPAQVAVLAEEPHRHLRYLVPVMRHGTLAALVASAIACGVAALFASGAGAGVVIPLGITAFATSIISPLQDFVRRMLHQAGFSGTAVVVAIVQLSIVLGAVGVLLATHVAPVWIPFSALGFANVVSVLAALVLIRRRGHLRDRGSLAPRGLLQSGKWLLVQGLTQYGMWFVGVAIVTALASRQDAGYAEAARLLAQPPVVLAMGLMSVIGPRLMAATQTREWGRARRLRLGFAGILLSAAMLYLLVVGIPWPVNPLVEYFAPAYVTRGLVAAMIVGQTAVWIAMIVSYQAISVREERAVARAGVLAAVAQTVVMLALGRNGALAIPAGLVVYAAVLGGLLEPVVRRLRDTPVPPSDSAAIPA